MYNVQEKPWSRNVEHKIKIKILSQMQDKIIITNIRDLGVYADNYSDHFEEIITEYKNDNYSEKDCVQFQKNHYEEMEKYSETMIRNINANQNNVMNNINKMMERLDNEIPNIIVQTVPNIIIVGETKQIKFVQFVSEICKLFDDYIFEQNTFSFDYDRKYKTIEYRTNNIFFDAMESFRKYCKYNDTKWIENISNITGDIHNFYNSKTIEFTNKINISIAKWKIKAYEHVENIGDISLSSNFVSIPIENIIHYDNYFNKNNKHTLYYFIVNEQCYDLFKKITFIDISDNDINHKFLCLKNNTRYIDNNSSKNLKLFIGSKIMMECLFQNICDILNYDMLIWNNLFKYPNNKYEPSMPPNTYHLCCNIPKHRLFIEKIAHKMMDIEYKKNSLF